MLSPLTNHLSGKSQSRWLTAVLLYVVSVVAFAQGSAETAEAGPTAAQQSDTLLVARTGSPRQTLQSWLNATREAGVLYERYRQDPTHANMYRMSFNMRVFLDLLDLSQAPAALRNETGFKATYTLADILARSVPDWDPFDEFPPGSRAFLGFGPFWPVRDESVYDPTQIFGTFV